MINSILTRTKLLVSILCRRFKTLLVFCIKRKLQGKSSLLIVMYSTERDEKEAIDKSNVLKGDRTRHAKPIDTYKEPSDEQGLPKTVLDGTDGMSSTS